MSPDKDYLKIAKAKVTKPSKRPPKWRLFLYSRHKKGKTTFCMSADEGKRGKVLIVDPETGTDKYRTHDPYVWYVTRWEDLDEVWGALRLGELSPKKLGVGPETKPFEWVALDGMTKINNFALRYVMKMQEETHLDRKPGIVDRRDYNKSGELLKQLMLNFDALPLGIIYTAQERMVNNEDSDDETSEASTLYVPDMPQGARGALNSIVDVIGRLYVTKAQFKAPRGGVVEKNQRRLWVGNHVQYDTGYRSEYELPDMIRNPSVPKLVKALLEGED